MKQLDGCGQPRDGAVAPHAGAWIETTARLSRPEYLWSPPTRGRGLKQYSFEDDGDIDLSPPTRGRGLKLEVNGIVDMSSRRPPRGGVD